MNCAQFVPDVEHVGRLNHRHALLLPPAAFPEQQQNPSGTENRLLPLSDTVPFFVSLPFNEPLDRNVNDEDDRAEQERVSLHPVHNALRIESNPSIGMRI